MERDDERLENYLREFHPRKPRPLATASELQVSRWRRIAAAAVVTIVMGISTWIVGRRQTTERVQTVIGQPRLEVRRQVSLAPLRMIPLTRLALEDPEHFDQTLDVASRRELPKLNGDDSTLRVLTKE